MISRQDVFRLAGMALAAGLPRTVVAAGSNNYTLTQLYDQWNFFKEFEFFGPSDPSRGSVTYVDAMTANQNKFAGYVDGLIYLGADHANVVTEARHSVRVNSTNQFNGGVFVADVVHMPSGKTHNTSCGLWPALWLSGPHWPEDGEIDIIEGINTQSTPISTFHTGDNCTGMFNKGSLDDTTLKADNCFGTTGCRQDATIKGAYGADFNSAGGGVYVLEWADDHLSLWFFGRGSDKPASLSDAIKFISSASPSYSSSPPPNPAPQIDISAFKTPVIKFNSGPRCSIKDNMRNNQIIINTDFCGWAGGDEWKNNEICSSLAPTCEEYVMQNGQAFEDAYWLIKSISVYQKTGDGLPEATSGNNTSNNKRDVGGIGAFGKEL